MATWHGYARIEIVAAFADALDDPARDKIRVALRRLITQTIKNGREFPQYHLGMLRWRLDRRAVIIEGNWDSTTKTDVVREWAAEMSKTQVSVGAAVTITRFAAGGEVGDYPPTFLPLQVRWSNRAVWEAEGV